MIKMRAIGMNGEFLTRGQAKDPSAQVIGAAVAIIRPGTTASKPAHPPRYAAVRATIPLSVRVEV